MEGDWRKTIGSKRAEKEEGEEASRGKRLEEIGRDATGEEREERRL